MTILVFLAIGILMQLLWGALGGIFQMSIHSSPLLICFAYGVICFPLFSRFWLSLTAGWLLDLTIGSYLGPHMVVFAGLSFIGTWSQRNLSMCQRKAFPVWVFGMSLLAGFGTWVVAIPFNQLVMNYSLFFQFKAAFLNAFWSIGLAPILIYFSQLLALENEERTLYVHGQ